ncbi:MAG: MFS transporter [Firmicutes bacterium]|nr:MFS transporter [Bacillota bacterium]
MIQSKSTLYKNNFWLLALEGTFVMAAISFFSSSTIIPVFINTMTNSKQLVGLTITLGSFFMYLGRLLIGPFIPHIKNHAKFSTTLMFMTRPILLLPALFIFIGLTKASVIALIAAYAIFWLCDGAVVPPWSEVLANTVDEQRQGRLLGWQMLLGGLAGIGNGALINILLANPQFDIKLAFGWIFLIGGIFSVLSCVTMAFVKNAPHPHKTGKIDIIGYYKGLPKCLKSEKDYARMMGIQFMFLTAAMCTPFTILFASDQLKMPQNMIALLILAQTLGAPIGGWMWGQICDRIGAHNGIKLAGANILLIAFLSLLAFVLEALNPMIIMLPVLFLAGISSGVWSCYYIYTVQVVSPESRPSCLVLSCVITLPASFASYVAGYILEMFGFAVLFFISIILTLVGMTLAWRLRPSKTVVAEKNALEI